MERLRQFSERYIVDPGNREYRYRTGRRDGWIGGEQRGFFVVITGLFALVTIPTGAVSDP